MILDKLGDVLGYLIVVSALFLPVVLFVPYALYQFVARFPWREMRERGGGRILHSPGGRAWRRTGAGSGERSRRAA